MKKRKIIVHLLILALAIACIGTGIKGGKRCWGVQQKSDYAHKYQAEYESYINSSVENVIYQYLYLRDFYNKDIVLVENEKYGVIRALDVINISKDKKLRRSYCDRIHKFIQKEYDGELVAGSEEQKEYVYSNGDEFADEQENYMNICSLSSLSYGKILPIDNSGIMKDFEVEINYLTAMIGENFFNEIEIDTDAYFEELYFYNVY